VSAAVAVQQLIQLGQRAGRVGLDEDAEHAHGAPPRHCR
jgi:hypothetical protein